MKLYPKGTRVAFSYRGQKLTGRVTGLLDKKRRVVADTGERAEVLVRGLKPALDKVLILESRLDRSVRLSKRTYAPMLKQLLEAYSGVEVFHERVHSEDDLAYFLRTEGRKLSTRFIHYMGHGKYRGGKKATLELTLGPVDLQDRAEIFSGLKGSIIIFSCCEVGANAQVLIHIKEVSGAAAVIGYRKEVVDTYTNLAEALLYDRLFANVSPQKAVKIVGDVMLQMGIRSAGTRKPVLVCV